MGAAIGRVSGFWNGLAGPSRRLIIGAVLIFVVGLVVLWQLSGSAAYSNLVTGADPSDAAAITKQLDSAGIGYKLSDGGATVAVPSDKLDQARLDLAQSNLLSGSGNRPGFELFDKQSLGATDFTQNVNLVRATEGELGRTIETLDPIQSATVNIAMPKDQLFSSQQQPTTASVVLVMKPGQTLDPGQVKGITNLVAHSVPGLKSGNITITDSQGNILSSGGGADAGVAGANSRMALQTAYERQTQSRLDAMLAGILGPGMAVTQVNAVLNLDKVTTQRETFDPKTKVPLDSSTSTETLKSKGGSAAGVTGASANTPGATYPQTSGGSGTTQYKKTTTQERNGVDHQRSSVVQAPGTLVSQSISVQLSDKVAASSVAKIQNAVRAAVGFVSGRDQISVQSVPFAAASTATASAAAATAAAKAPAAKSSGGFDPMSYAKPAAVGLGVLLLLFMARKALRRRQSELEKALPELLSRGPVPVAELDKGAQTPPPALEGQRKSTLQQQVEDLATRQPEDVAQLLRGWLVESKN
jgi:flagellar M-ring protein FliF